MGQISPFLRRATTGYSHWCPGCEEMHLIPNGWVFDGNTEQPTFNPSVRITGKQRVKVDGKWVGGWVTGPDGKALDGCCHYFLHGGMLKYCADSTHVLAGSECRLPPLPPHLTDEVT